MRQVALRLVCVGLLVWTTAALEFESQPRQMPLLSAPREILATGDFSLVLCVRSLHLGAAADADIALDVFASHLQTAIDTKSPFIATKEAAGTARPHCTDGFQELVIRAAGDHRRHAMSQLSVALFAAERRQALGIGGNISIVTPSAAAARRQGSGGGGIDATPDEQPPAGRGRHFFAANASTAVAATTSTAPVVTTAVTVPSNTSVDTEGPATPAPSALPANMTAAATATIRINGSAFVALLVLNRSAVVEAVAADLGTLIDVAPRYIFIANMYVGSLVVEFVVDADGGVLPHVIAERLASATRSSVWLSRTQAIYVAVSDETLRVSVSPVIAATAPPGTVTPPPLPLGNGPSGASVPPEGDDSPAAVRASLPTAARSCLLLLAAFIALT
jgi:hypothetical protein